MVVNNWEQSFHGKQWRDIKERSNIGLRNLVELLMKVDGEGNLRDLDSDVE